MHELRVGEAERLLFISDLHLCETRQPTTAAFFSFLDRSAREAAHLFILGDLFEYWPGDDDDSALADEVAQRLRACREHGTACHFIAGNRDFLLGTAYARRAGLELLDDPTLLTSGSQRLLLMHGDTLCTEDHAYQAFRREVRDPAWIASFLARTLPERRAIIEGARRHSERSKQSQPEAIMDASAQAVAETFARHDWPLMVHGHTHRCAHHRLRIDGRLTHRWVLPDWHGHARYLVWQGGRGEFVGLDPGAAG